MGVKTLAALGVTALAQVASAWHFELPPCLDEFSPYVYNGCFKDGGDEQTLIFRASLEREDMTVEKCAAYCKGNGYRYAGLEYYGVCFCGQTINNVQLPEEECNFPCNGDSSQTCGGDNIISIWLDPTFPDTSDATIEDYDPAGCYTDEDQGARALSWRMDDLPADTMTTETCLQACKGEGFPFAGIEFGGECYCGVALANNTVKVDSSECAMPCNGDDSQICGGPRRLTLYIADELVSLQPCGYEEPSVTPTPTPEPTITPPPSGSTTAPEVCTSTVTVPSECEYKCGKWCAGELPPWDDDHSCKKASDSCLIQVAACFKNAGFPDVLDCFKFSQWCGDTATHCKRDCKSHSGKCGKGKWYKERPPHGHKPARTTTTTAPCVTTTTTTTTTVVPEPTNICVQPTSKRHGYGPGNPVGGIEMPIVTCNDISSDFGRWPFKLYSSSDSRKCKGYGRDKVPNACVDACKEQYDDCKDVYAEGCRVYGGGSGGGGSGGWGGWFWRRENSYFEKRGSGSVSEKRTFSFGDSWGGAKDKCKAQYDDCVQVNKKINPGKKCNVYGK